ncbi:hypothetical protein G9E11_19980 [Arthrobacter sp. IA7]|uniref:methyltransferase domain-containing protein n=1 Tax=Arthrobacter ipis TaxID=2716202 RepID=UPI00168A0B8D|nr:methyltransferase domain-containing protein [Arthrobacter ipis]MBD1544476.1 hypothetical protein [Arthrobacter ipis]
MTDILVQHAYATRAADYTALFGSTDAAHEQDQRLIAGWANSLRGSAIDAGCGPGHWTALLADHGVDVEGIDLVPSSLQRRDGGFRRHGFEWRRSGRWEFRTDIWLASSRGIR